MVLFPLYVYYFSTDSVLCQAFFCSFFLLFARKKGGALRTALNNCRYFILNATYPAVYRLHAAILPIGDLKQRQAVGAKIKDGFFFARKSAFRDKLLTHRRGELEL